MTDEKPRVWGIGLSRTGTTSLTIALHELGYETVQHPTLQQLFFEDLDSATDETATAVYKFLDVKYPNSKFILTERPQRDEWLRSVRTLMDMKMKMAERLAEFLPDSVISELPDGAFEDEDGRDTLDFGAFLRALPSELPENVPTVPDEYWDYYRSYIRTEALSLSHLYGTFEFNETLYSEAYDQHISDVLDYFDDRPDDLLRLKVCEGEGWDKLCSFLDLPVPDKPFPKRNTSESLEIPDEFKQPAET